MQLKENGKIYEVVKRIERSYDWAFNEGALDEIGDKYYECTDGWYLNKRSGCRVNLAAIENPHLFFIEMVLVQQSAEENLSAEVEKLRRENDSLRRAVLKLSANLPNEYTQDE